MVDYSVKKLYAQLVLRIWIPGRLPGLNELLNSKRQVFQMGKGSAIRDGYSELKQKHGRTVEMVARMAQSSTIRGGSHFTYLFFEPNRKRDPSNLVCGGVKIIEDGLKAAGVIPNDGWEDVRSISAYWDRSTELVGCVVFIGDFPLTRDEAIECDRKARQNDGKTETNGIAGIGPSDERNALSETATRPVAHRRIANARARLPPGGRARG